MKKLLVVSLLAFASNAFSEQLQDYNAVKAAIESGKQVRIGVDFSQCVAKDPIVSNIDIGVFTPNEIILAKDGRIIASLLHFTKYSPSSHNVPVYQYVRYVLNPNNQLTLSINVLSAPDFSPVAGGGVMDCKMNVAVKVYS